MSTYIGQKEIQQLKSGNWEHHAGRMSIKSRDGTKTIEGPGFIRQIHQEHFQIVIFDVSSTGGLTENLRKLLNSDEKKAGEIIPASEGYALETPAGWKSKHISSPSPYFSPDGAIHTAYTREIFCESKRNSAKAKAGVSFISFHEYKGYPSNKAIRYGKYFEDKGKPGIHRCAAETKGWKYDILFWVHDGETHLQLNSNRKKKTHNDKIENRAIEALEFVLGTPVEWNIKRVYDSKMRRVHIRLVPSYHSVRIQQPYLDNWIPGTPAFSRFWKLYDQYLRHILKDTQTGYSEMGYLLRNLAFLRSIKHDISTYGLYLSIVIERVVNGSFRRKFRDSSMETVLPVIKNAVEEVLSEEPPELRNRILSHIGNLKRKDESTKRTLLRLDREGKIQKQRIDSWSNLRNKFAHGEKVTFNQKLVSDLGNMETLLFQLLFMQIGYQGLYRDYGQLGYPLKEYPKDL